MPKRYRHTGKERDEESGFSYHGARYCASWLGRWVSPDPAGVIAEGTNLYRYSRDNPVRYSDSRGTQSKDENEKKEPAVGQSTVPGPGSSDTLGLPPPPHFELRPPNFYNASTAQGHGIMELGSLDVEAFGLGTYQSFSGLSAGGHAFGLSTGGLAIRQQLGAPGFDVGIVGYGSYMRTFIPGQDPSTSSLYGASGTLHYGYQFDSKIGLAGYASVGVAHSVSGDQSLTGATLSVTPALSYEPEHGFLAGLYFNPLFSYAQYGSLSQGPSLHDLSGVGGNLAVGLRFNEPEGPRPVQFGLTAEVGVTRNWGQAEEAAHLTQSGESWLVRPGIALTANYRSGSAPAATSSVALGAWLMYENGAISGTPSPSSPSGGFSTLGVNFGLVLGYRRPPAPSQ
jgi:RHS repeat-associated protein